MSFYDKSGGTTFKKLTDEDEVLLALNGVLCENTLKSRVIAKRIEATMKSVGEGRVVDFNIMKEIIDRELTNVRNTLEEYYNDVELAWGLFFANQDDTAGRQIYSPENVRRERSLNNIEQCSTSETFYLYEKPFLKMVYRLGNCVNIDRILTAHDLPCWEFSFMHQGGLSARGVCMVFERKDKTNNALYKIKYVDPETDLKKVAELLKALKDKGIRFRLNLLKKYRHFLKHADYDTEEEYRLLMRSERPDGWFINRDNRILTPYLERELWKGGMQKDGDYPFRLSRIIIGPAMTEMYANLIQVFYMAHNYGYSNYSVDESKIHSYR